MTCESSLWETTGPSFEAKTMAYSSSFLAYGTVQNPGPNCDEYVVAGGFHTIDFNDLYYNPITTSESQKPGCPPFINPRLSLPLDLTSVDPAWASCEPLFYGAFDPPRVLQKASGGLVPSSAAQPSITSVEPTAFSSVSAAAHAVPASAVSTPTVLSDGSTSLHDSSQLWRSNGDSSLILFKIATLTQKVSSLGPSQRASLLPVGLYVLCYSSSSSNLPRTEHILKFTSVY